MASTKSAAELALERKYEALRQKKQAGSGASLSGPTQPANPGREAALRALQASRTEGTSKSTAAPPVQLQSAPTQSLAKRARTAPSSPSADRLSAISEPAPSGRRPLPPSRRTVAPSGPRPRRQSPPPDEYRRRDISPEIAEAEHADSSPGSTLFVGDLPAHWTKHHLFDYFQQYAAVLDAKTVLNQAYGFVTFAAPQEATGVMDLAQQEPLVTPEGFALRVNWARGSLPDWKRGGEGAAAPGDVPLHPRVREAQERAAAVASTIDESTLAEVNLQAPPPQRPLVSYDDI